jgi:hypothetical protein
MQQMASQISIQTFTTSLKAEYHAIYHDTIRHPGDPKSEE